MINERVQLTDRMRATIEAIVRRFANSTGEIRVFGSRADGRARPSSDLDLVVYPPLSRRTLFDLMDAFETSDLPISVDIVDWASLEDDGLRQAILHHSIPLVLEDT